MKRSQWIFLSLLIELIAYSNLVICKDSFSALSENVFTSIKCVPYAYADFNSDKLVDIFCVSNPGKHLKSYLH
jgi:hypothetical protein